MNNQPIETHPSQITIRPFKITDVDDFILWAGDDQVTRNLMWETITSKEEALACIQDVCIPHPWRRSICIDDRSIGFVSIFRESGGYRHRAYLGYAVSREYWSRGVATVAVKLAVDQVFKNYPDLVRLQAYVDVENQASQSVLDKCGFVKEGLLRKYSNVKGQTKDVFVYSLLSTDLSVAVA